MPSDTSEPAPQSNNAEEEAEFAAYIKEVIRLGEEQKRKAKEAAEKYRELCRQNPIFHHFHSFGLASSASVFTRFKPGFKVGTFRCGQCGSAPFGPHWAYPHLDPTSVLTAAQIRQLRGRVEKVLMQDVLEAPETRACITQLEDAWQVPITAGTRLGPSHLEVGRPLTQDIETVMWSGAIFARRKAVLALLKHGFEFDFVEVVSTGKYAKEGDFVQLVVPIIAHEAIHPAATYCASCRRVNEDKLTWTSKWPALLYQSPNLDRYPFFST